MKYVKEIIDGLPSVKTKGDLSRTIKDIQYDSRLINPEDAFVAIRGAKHDGHFFINDLHKKGCRVFVVEEIPVLLPNAVFVQVNDTRRALPQLAINFFDRAAHKLKITGITGTNGKTTCAYLLYSILNQAHWKPGLISTIEYIIKEKHIPAQRTTPESLDLHRLFHDMRQSHLKSVVMEVSSHALATHRTDGIPFNAAVFTNIGHDHLDFHKDMERYFLAKKKLFDELPESSSAVINMDDPFSERISKDTSAEIFTYSYANREATVSLKSCQAVSDGTSVTLAIPAGFLTINTFLIGKYNVYNLMAAVATAVSLGLQNEFIISGIEALLNVPGRSQRFNLLCGAKVFIDYAHTPDALKRVLQALLEYKPEKLILVFGCGGDRDLEKRPVMGKIAEDYADVVIITNDNPRSEKPMQIIDQIKNGIFDVSKINIFPDRKKAIYTALESAGPDDIVLVAGKGHENYQEFADKRIHFDDREVVKSFIEQKN